MTSAENKCAKSKKCVCDNRLDGRVVVITGGNAGIGYYTAKDLVTKGAHVILACRSAERAKAAVEKIIEETGSNLVEYQLLDLANLQSVRNFAEEFCKKHTKLDILVNNAGVATEPGLTGDGFEVHFQVNHLGHFLLTNLLLEDLKRADQGRIVTVSSLAHKMGKVEWEKFKANVWPTVLAYSNSKLCNVLFTRELAKKLTGTNVTANCLHPGVVDTGLVSGSYIFQMWTRFAKTFSLKQVKTPEEGAQTSIHVCVCPELSKVTGEYFSDCAVVEPSSKAKNDADAARLWKVSADFVGITA